MPLTVAVLDGLEAHLDGVDVAPPGAKARQVLALLALRAGRVVPVDTIAEELWADTAPATSRTMVQTYVLQIRRAIDRSGQDGRRLVERCGDGYRLRADDGPEIDADRFAQLSVDASAALRAGDAAEASNLAGAALRLWRGGPLVGLPLGAHLEAEAVRFENLHALAVETRFDAEVRAGNHRHVLGDLAGEVARHPLNEHLSSTYAVALYRSGRQDQALEVFRRLRSRLRRDLGVEPSPATQSLLAGLLSADPAVAGQSFAATWPL